MLNVNDTKWIWINVTFDEYRVSFQLISIIIIGDQIDFLHLFMMFYCVWLIVSRIVCFNWMCYDSFFFFFLNMECMIKDVHHSNISIMLIIYIQCIQSKLVLKSIFVVKLIINTHYFLTFVNQRFLWSKSQKPIKSMDIILAHLTWRNMWIITFSYTKAFMHESK